MKLTSLVLMVTAVANFAAAQEQAVRQRLTTTDKIVWAGLDYSLMRMMGGTNAIRVPDLLFQDMPARWNDLFLDERLEGVAERLQKQVVIDVAAVTKRNKKLSKSQIAMENVKREAVEESHISSADISGLVKSFELESESGLGLIFIIDRFVCGQVPRRTVGRTEIPEHTVYGGALYVVFFDVGTRQVISARREVRQVATGGSFRNFWFGPIKQVDEQIGQYR